VLHAYGLRHHAGVVIPLTISHSVRWQAECGIKPVASYSYSMSRGIDEGSQEHVRTHQTAASMVQLARCGAKTVCQSDRQVHCTEQPVV
jgi:hypothetical protein